jgi:hypothetical protein
LEFGTTVYCDIVGLASSIAVIRAPTAIEFISISAAKEPIVRAKGKHSVVTCSSPHRFGVAGTAHNVITIAAVMDVNTQSFEAVGRALKGVGRRKCVGRRKYAGSHKYVWVWLFVWSFVAAKEDVTAVAAIQAVVAFSTLEGVIAIIAVENIVTVATHHHVVTVAAINDIVVRASIDGVVALTAVDEVVASAGIDHVIAPPTDDRIISGRSHDHVITVGANTGNNKSKFLITRTFYKTAPSGHQLKRGLDDQGRLHRMAFGKEQVKVEHLPWNEFELFFQVAKVYRGSLGWMYPTQIDNELTIDEQPGIVVRFDGDIPSAVIEKLGVDFQGKVEIVRTSLIAKELIVDREKVFAKEAKLWIFRSTDIFEYKIEGHTEIYIPISIPLIITVLAASRRGTTYAISVYRFQVRSKRRKQLPDNTPIRGDFLFEIRMRVAKITERSWQDKQVHVLRLGVPRAPPQESCHDHTYPHPPTNMFHLHPSFSFDVG